MVNYVDVKFDLHMILYTYCDYFRKHIKMIAIKWFRFCQAIKKRTLLSSRCNLLTTHNFKMQLLVSQLNRISRFHKNIFSIDRIGQFCVHNFLVQDNLVLGAMLHFLKHDCPDFKQYKYQILQSCFNNIQDLSLFNTNLL